MSTVVGTGNPAVDVPAVQAAVNQPGDVLLKGHFSFDSSPTIPTAFPPAVGYPNAMVLVSKAVTISGAHNEHDERANIEGGTIPFYVQAPGASVTIQRLRFTNPSAKAITVFAANGLTIAHCKIDGVVPVLPLGSAAIDIDTTGTVPVPPPGNPGQPQNIFGRVLVANNEIDVSGGTAKDTTLGIVVFSVGQSPDNEADIYVVGNKITNTTQTAINFRLIGGRAYVLGNEITTGSVSGPSSPPEVIRAVNTGSYVIARNTIQCEWPDPNAIGIGVFSQTETEDWFMEHAHVMHNSVTMSPPTGVTFGPLSAGIDIRGFAKANNVVAHNRVGGRARAAYAVDNFKGGNPDHSAFICNCLDTFEASIADTFVGAGVTNTLLIGQPGTIENLGVDTLILPGGGGC